MPAIKCTDPDSAISCKSFKQLVDARDKRLLDSLTGEKDSLEKHIAYVCPRPKDDVFNVIEFDEPLPYEYLPYSQINQPDTTKTDLSKADLSSLEQMTAFRSYEVKVGKPLLQRIEAGKKWYEDHSDFYVYYFGSIYVDSWARGILANQVWDFGKWQRLGPQGGATFESAHQWLADFNLANDGELAYADDREIPRISLDDTRIYVRYSYENTKDEDVDYTLTIQRSTGRFTESFSAPGLDPWDDSGTCMIYK